MLLDRLVTKCEHYVLGILDKKLEISGQKACFTFDDVPRSAIHFMLEEYPSIPCTYFISGGLCNQVINGCEICTTSDLIGVDWTLNELASHSYGHLDFRVNKVSLLVEDLKQNAKFLKKHVPKELSGFAYPKGRYGWGGQKSLLKSKVKYARTTKFGLNIKRVRRYGIKAIPLYEKFYTLEDISKLLSQAAGYNDVMVVFYTHDVTDNFSDFGCSRKYFSAVLKLVEDNKFKITTVSKALGLQ